MARKIMQDIVTGKGKKTHSAIRATKKVVVVPDTQVSRTSPKTEPTASIPVRPARPDRSRWKRKSLIFASVILLAGVVFIILSAAFSHATVDITPRTASVSINSGFTAQKGPGGEIPFEIILIKGSESKQVAPTGTKQIDQKASGRVVIYNNYSPASQKLVKNTRFSAANGKIYRINSDITVPGTSLKSGETIPGSIETTVYADVSGAEYNVGLTDFTIPGFKGDPRYDAFYARSKTEISGGFSGSAPVASDKDIATARTELRTSLKEDLLREASSQIPTGYILFSDAIQISFEDTQDIDQSKTAVSPRVNGSLVGVLLKEDTIKNEITKKISAQQKDTLPFQPTSISSLKFAFGSSTGTIDSQTQEVNFTLTGNETISYDVDGNRLATDLAGKPKNQFAQILANYPSVSKAKISQLRPFWSRYFPGETNKVTVRFAKD